MAGYHLSPDSAGTFALSWVQNGNRAKMFSPPLSPEVQRHFCFYTYGQAL